MRYMSVRPGNTWFLVKVDDYYWIMNTLHVGKQGEDFRTDNTYLSASQDGSWVRMWNKDDESGRQRWKIKWLKDGSCNIMVVGGVKGKRRYLGWFKNHPYLMLYEKDDGSGMQ